MRALRYAFDEAISSLWRGRTSGVLSTATIAVALFVLGAFLVLTSNLERLGSEWSRAAEMSVYLDDDATPEMRAAVEGQIEAESLPLVLSGMLYDDGVIDPRDTRTVVGMCLSAIANGPIKGTSNFGVFRM